MEKLKLYVKDCPINSFKITGEKVIENYPEALKMARLQYLGIYDNIYRELMFKNFNPLWTPDRQTTNDIDPKDGFWSMYVFFFNTSLVKILSEKYDVEIIDQTSYEFRNQKYFLRFLKSEGITFVVSKKARKRPFKRVLKAFIKNKLLETRECIIDFITFFREKFIDAYPEPDFPFEKNAGQKTIYLAIPPVSNKKIEFYLSWRYKKIFEVLREFKKHGYKILLVSIKDYTRLNNLDFDTINAINLISKKEKFKILGLSLWYKIRVKGYIWWKSITSNDPLEKYFIKNIPTNLYFALEENRAYDKLFETFGQGLYIMKGPIVYKGICMRNYNARKHGVRSLSVSGRVMTPSRLTNSLLNAHTNSQYPEVLPHSMLVTDPISYETITKQTDKIKIYTEKLVSRFENGIDDIHEPYSIALLLQKKNEMESMIDAVLTAIQDFDNVILNLKQHPAFPIPRYVKEKYRDISLINILPLDYSLLETVQISDICITSYSTAVFQFLSYCKPIIWLKNITLNDLLLTEMQEKMGISVNSIEELTNLLHRMMNDTDFYQKQCKEQHIQFQKFVNDLDGKKGKNNVNLEQVIEKELQLATKQPATVRV